MSRSPYIKFLLPFIYDRRRKYRGDLPADGKKSIKPAGQACQKIKEEHDADKHKQEAGEDFKETDVDAEALEESKETVKEEAGEEEGDSESDGIGREEERPLADVPRGRCNHEDGTENRTDTGGPASGKDDADKDRTEITMGFVVEMNPLFTEEEAELQDAGEVQAKEKDEEAADLLQPAQSFLQRAHQSPGCDAGQSTETDEDQRETGDKEEGMTQDRHSHLMIGMFLLQLIKGEPGDIAQVRRDERQDAWRKEGEDPGGEGDPQADIRRSPHYLPPEIWALKNLRASVDDQSRAPTICSTMRPFWSITKVSGNLKTL